VQKWRLNLEIGPSQFPSGVTPADLRDDAEGVRVVRWDMMSPQMRTAPIRLVCVECDVSETEYRNQPRHNNNINSYRRISVQNNMIST
jgi:hypothetical protein